MKRQPKFEIITNKEVKKIVRGYKRLENEEYKFSDVCEKNGLENIFSSTNGSCGKILFFNKKTLETATFAWREILPFVDMNDEVIYDGDLLSYQTPYGDTFELNEEPFEEGKFYLRSTKTPMWDRSKQPITAKEIKESYCVIHCVFESIKSEIKNG